MLNCYCFCFCSQHFFYCPIFFWPGNVFLSNDSFFSHSGGSIRFFVEARTPRRHADGELPKCFTVILYFCVWLSSFVFLSYVLMCCQSVYDNLFSFLFSFSFFLFCPLSPVCCLLYCVFILFYFFVFLFSPLISIYLFRGLSFIWTRCTIFILNFQCPEAEHILSFSLLYFLFFAFFTDVWGWDLGVCYSGWWDKYTYRANGCNLFQLK